MNAVAIFPKAQRLKVLNIARPVIEAPDDVLVKTLEVGLCGTDKEIARFEYGSPPEGSDFLILGHEALGRVIETGSAVKRIRPGDLVVPTVRRPCGDPTCSACAVDRQDFCYTGKFTERGIKGIHGFMADVFVEKEKYLHPLQALLRDIGVLTEPLTIARKALRQVLGIQERLPWECRLDPAQQPPAKSSIACRRTLILGAGPVGLLGAMTFAHGGFDTIVYSRMGDVPARAEITRAIGCRFVAAEEVEPKDLLHRIGKVDVVYEAVGASQLAFDVLNVLGPNAVFVFTGVPGRKTKLTLNTDVIMRNLVLKNQVLLGTVNASAEDFESAVGALARFRHTWPGIVEKLKTGIFRPEDAPDLLQHSGGIKNVIAFQK